MKNPVTLPSEDVLRRKLTEKLGKFPHLLALVAGEFISAACRPPSYPVRDGRDHLWQLLYFHWEASSTFQTDDGLVYFLKKGAVQLCELLEFEPSLIDYVRERGATEIGALVCKMPEFRKLQPVARKIWKERLPSFETEATERQHIKNLWDAMPGKWANETIHSRSYASYSLGFEVIAGDTPEAKRTHRQLHDLQAMMWALAVHLNEQGSMPDPFLKRVKRSFAPGGAGPNFAYSVDEAKL